MQLAIATAGILGLVGSAGCSMIQERIHAGSADGAGPEPKISQVAFQPADDRTIYLVGHGWHTGIVIRVADVSSERWPEINDFREYRYAEIGWGDEGFYRMQGLQAGNVFKAALWPSASVLHVAAFDAAPDELFEHSDVVALQLEEQEYDALCRFIANTIQRTASGAATDLGAGLYGYSRFYRGSESYYLPKTCNMDGQSFA